MTITEYNPSLTVKEYTRMRDEWILSVADMLRIKEIAQHVDLSESRVKGILARMRRAKNGYL